MMSILSYPGGHNKAHEYIPLCALILSTLKRCEDSSAGSLDRSLDRSFSEALYLDRRFVEPSLANSLMFYD
jgi:hypothetical protein